MAIKKYRDRTTCNCCIQEYIPRLLSQLLVARPKSSAAERLVSGALCIRRRSLSRSEGVSTQCGISKVPTTRLQIQHSQSQSHQERQHDVACDKAILITIINHLKSPVAPLLEHDVLADRCQLVSPVHHQSRAPGACRFRPSPRIEVRR